MPPSRKKTGRHDFTRAEKKWRAAWQKEDIYEPALGGRSSGARARQPFYNLMMFPYPSAEGLHVGNMYAFTGSDVYGRFQRMQGKDVFEPMGLDGFGIHSENYAIKVGTHPVKQAPISEKRFYEQLRAIGNGFAWKERLETYDPEYYKWTQWIFTQLFKAGLAYRKKQAVNWCPKDQTVLADEQVEGGKCERCGTVVEKRELEQWFFRITKYAEQLLQNTEKLDWTEKVRIAQRNWIGRSEGAEIDFQLAFGPYSGDAAFASNNLSKHKRAQRLLQAAGLDIRLKLPKDLGIDEFEVEEDGATLAENSEKKARAMAKHTKLPIIAIDEGLFIDGAPVDPIRVKRNALGKLNEKDLTVKQVAEKVFAYYQKLVAKHGGALDAEWHSDICMLTPEGFAMHAEAVRPITITSEARGQMDPYFPLRHIYISKATGKYVLEQSQAEELRELQPITTALKKLFTPAVNVFTTRPDTLFGATYLVLAPEHPFVAATLQKPGLVKNNGEVETYVSAAKKKSEEERITESEKKTGVELQGVMAVNPATQKEIPIWVADYVLGGYGTGAIMAVPAHDERDAEFAKKFGLPIKKVVEDGPGDPKAIRAMGGQFGTLKVQYRLRDWLISRQRYWGPPIPMTFCKQCAAGGKGEQASMPGWYAVPEKDLPVKLPLVKDFRPQGTGQSPLASVKSFYETKCPACKSKARRETDVSDTFLDSAWYYLRYPNVGEKKRAWDPAVIDKMFPVDMYIGGAEHSVLHLLYVRFLSLALHDMKLLAFPKKGATPAGEPFPVFRAHGLIIKEGAKMSKSKGNVVNPDEYIKRYGADTLRMYLMFLAPFEQGGDFRDQAVSGISRFLERTWRFISNPGNTKSESSAEEGKIIHQTIKKVTQDIATLHYNTAISALMICLNGLEERGGASKNTKEVFVKLIAPFAPYLSEELWRGVLGHKTSVHVESWPQFDELQTQEKTINLVIQVNSKTRATVRAPADISEEGAKELALGDPKIKAALGGQAPRRVIYVPGRLVNIVV